jgi:hypothetical protein
MSGPFNTPRNLWTSQARNLAYMLGELLDSHEYRALTPENQQKGFNYAMEILHRPRTNTNQEILARIMLRTLANDYSRSWTTHPSSRYFNGNNYNPNANLYSNRNNSSASNTNNNRSPRRNRPATVSSSKPNSSAPHPNSKVRKFVDRWRLKGPIKLVNLPPNQNKNKHNRTDPVNLHVFRVGHEAIQHQRRNTQGRVISTRYYLLSTIEKLAGMKWSAIRRMHPNKVLVKGVGPGNKFLATKHLPNVITRLPMYRRNLTLVKFK